MKKGSVKNFLSSFADFVSTVITAFLVLFVIVLVLLRAFGVSIFTVESGSMAPKYPVNSVVLVKEEKLNNIKKRRCYHLCFERRWYACHTPCR